MNTIESIDNCIDNGIDDSAKIYIDTDGYKYDDDTDDDDTIDYSAEIADCVERYGPEIAHLVDSDDGKDVHCNLIDFYQNNGNANYYLAFYFLRYYKGAYELEISRRNGGEYDESKHGDYGRWAMEHEWREFHIFCRDGEKLVQDFKAYLQDYRDGKIDEYGEPVPLEKQAEERENVAREEGVEYFDDDDDD